MFINVNKIFLVINLLLLFGFNQITYAYNAIATRNITLGGSVLAKCIINNVTDMDFGEYDVLFSKGDIFATARINARCVNGVSYIAKLNVGQGVGASFAQRYMMLDGNKLSYNLYTDAQHLNVWGDGSYGTATVAGIGTGQDQSLTIYGMIPNNQPSIRSGLYTDVIVVSLEY